MINIQIDLNIVFFLIKNESQYHNGKGFKI